tara:strand:- start:1656 stop:2168 length:513 start_codon:yes stop_codon:yes gene_type:complete
MSAIVSYLKEKLSDVLCLLKDPKALGILAITAVFIGIALYYYNTTLANKIKPNYVANNEFKSEDFVEETREAKLYLFTVNWCPLCKSTAPIWQELKNEYNKQTINKHLVLFEEINGDDDKKVGVFENTFLSGKGKIDAFPTIYLVKGNQVIEFQATPTKESMEEFLHTVL